jgi:hypothetical protein
MRLSDVRLWLLMQTPERSVTSGARAVVLKLMSSLYQGRVGVWMKFASWNISRRDAGVAALVENLNPDIAFFQECKRPELLEVPGYQVVGNSVNERGRNQDWGNAIISKFPLHPVEIVSEYSGSLVCALAELPDGKTLGLVNIYGLLESSPIKPEVKVVHYGIHPKLMASLSEVTSTKTAKWMVALGSRRAGP